MDEDTSNDFFVDYGDMSSSSDVGHASKSSLDSDAPRGSKNDVGRMDSTENESFWDADVEESDSFEGTESRASDSQELPEILKTKDTVMLGLTNCQTNLMLKLAAFYESGSTTLDYGRCEPKDRHHGIAAGYVDLTTKQGGIERAVKNYVSMMPEGTPNPFRIYMELLADTASGTAGPDDVIFFDGFCDVWKNVSSQTPFRKAFDAALLDLYITPTIDASRSLQLKQPLSIIILFDSILHLGLGLLDSQIIPNITTSASDEPMFISRLLLLRKEHRQNILKLEEEAFKKQDDMEEWDTAPDSRWEAGLAAYASLVVANGKTAEGLAKSFALRESSIAVAGDVNGTQRVDIQCEIYDPAKVRKVERVVGGKDRSGLFADLPKSAGAVGSWGGINAASRFGASLVVMALCGMATVFVV
ncbi:hypothetical protein BC829DRAFT_4984 [Chytridium lagenaria]|nr:hypothetical protein BC829DRAFT_4984 [Chytridium lagenaria]